MPATWLYVPAPRVPDRLAKAVAASEGGIVDLGAATHPSQRAQARELVAGVRHQAAALAVRVNHVGSPDFELDVAAVGPLLTAGVISEIHLPKVETAADVA